MEGNGIDPDVAAFGEYMEGLADAVREAGDSVREGLMWLARAVNTGPGVIPHPDDREGG